MARVQLVEAFLEPRWRALSHQAVSRPQRYRHWAEALALKAGLSPTALKRAIEEDESFWSYRIWQ